MHRIRQVHARRRRATWRFLPRQAAKRALRRHYRPTPTVVRATMASASALGMASAPQCDDREDNEENTGMPVKTDTETEVKVRVVFTELMQHAVEVPGQQVSGILLTGMAR